MKEYNPYESPYTETAPSPYVRELRMWAMFIHLSVLAGLFVAPVVGWVLPIALWQVKKDDIPELDVHGRIVANWLLSFLIYSALCLPLAFLLVGVPLFFVLVAMNVVFAVIGGLKAHKGEVWHYPMSFRFL